MRTVDPGKQPPQPKRFAGSNPFPLRPMTAADLARMRAQAEKRKALAHALKHARP